MKERVLNADRVREIVKEAGLDMKKFDADMADVALDRQIEDTILLSNRIPQLTGTPFFMVNEDYVSGANLERLDDLLEAALDS
jgi:predicted DsbA family dithiol-disulfide isomerase